MNISSFRIIKALLLVFVIITALISKADAWDKEPKSILGIKFGASFTDIFIEACKTPSFGRGQRSLALPVSCPPANPWLELSPQFKSKGVADEQVSEVIPRVVEVSISSGLGSEVPLPSVERSGRRGVVQMYPRIHRAIRLRSGGVERATGPCASIGEDHSESLHIGVYGNNQRSNCYPYI